MKNAYPIIITPNQDGYVVYIPDFDANTEGGTVEEAMEMARDAIGLLGIDYEDEGKELPQPSEAASIHVAEGDLMAIVDIDFAEYRSRHAETKKDD